MVKTISYIKKGLFLCLVLCAYNTNAQDKYLSEDIDMVVLSAQDMNMNSDTSQIKVMFEKPCILQLINLCIMLIMKMFCVFQQTLIM